MNEEALETLYGLAQQDGYTKSLDEFKQLMNENEEALNQVYGLAQSDGYGKDIEQFKTLVGYGLKKKEGSEPTATKPHPGSTPPPLFEKRK